MTKFSLIDLEAEMLTGRKQVKTGQRERLSERTPDRGQPRVMRQSELAGNELREGKSKNFPRSLISLVSVELLDLAVKMFSFAVDGFRNPMTGRKHGGEKLAQDRDLQTLFAGQYAALQNVKDAFKLILPSDTPHANGLGIRVAAIVGLKGQYAAKFAVDVAQHVGVIVAKGDLNSWLQLDVPARVGTPRRNAKIAFTPEEAAEFSAPDWVKRFCSHA